MGNIEITDVYFAPPSVRIFEGPHRFDVEAAVRADGRKVASIEALLEYRLKALDSGNKTEIDRAWNKGYDSSTWAAYWRDQIKIGEGFSMPENAKLENGTLQRTVEQYKALNGKVFSRKDLGAAGLFNDWLPKEKVLKHPVWRTVGGKAFPRYVDAQFRKYKNAMGFSILDLETETPEQRPLVLNGGYGRWSDLDGYWDLGLDARLVGVREKNLSSKVTQK